jgi:hypothetical protein
MRNMLFELTPSVQPALQRQLDADQLDWSRRLQAEIEGAFTAEDREAFRMHGLFGAIPGTDSRPLTMNPKS